MQKLLLSFLFLGIFLFYSCNTKNKEVSKPVKPVDSIIVTTTDSVVDTLLSEAKVLGDTLYRRAEKKKRDRVTPADLEEVNTRFTLRGAYINPKLLEEFLPWESDEKDAIMSIDIAPYNAGSNKYYCDTPPYKTKEGYVKLEVRNSESGGVDYSIYKWLGMLDNGVHVLKFIQDGTGFSGVFHTLLFVRFDMKKHFTNGRFYRQLLMENEGVYTIGDRVDYQVSLNKKDCSVTINYKESDGKVHTETLRP